MYISVCKCCQIKSHFYAAAKKNFKLDLKYKLNQLFFISGSSSSKTKYPILVFINGESYEWDSGNQFDGTILSSFGQVIVVTLNYRLGILGKNIWKYLLKCKQIDFEFTLKEKFSLKAFDKAYDLSIRLIWLEYTIHMTCVYESYDLNILLVVVKLLSPSNSQS